MLWELEQVYSLVDMVDLHDALDLQAELNAKAMKAAQEKPPTGGKRGR